MHASWCASCLQDFAFLNINLTPWRIFNFWRHLELVGSGSVTDNWVVDISAKAFYFGGVFYYAVRRTLKGFCFGAMDL